MNILMIDDDSPLYLGILDTWCRGTGINWEYATNGRDGLKMLAEKPIGLVLMDGNLMDGEYGHDVVCAIRAAGISVPVCMFSSDEKQCALGMEAGAEYAVNKNVFIKELRLGPGNSEVVERFALFRFDRRVD